MPSSCGKADLFPVCSPVKHGVRVPAIVPEMRPFPEQQFADAQEGEEFVLP